MYGRSIFQEFVHAPCVNGIIIQEELSFCYLATMCAALSRRTHREIMKFNWRDMAINNSTEAPLRAATLRSP
jgi:hypothetical protein